MSSNLKKYIIVSAASNGCIGKDGELPWLFSGGLNWLKKTTLHHCVIIGRKTFESIDGPLHGRLNIVLTRSDNSEIINQHKDIIRTASSPYSAFEICGRNVMHKCFICGGAQVYKDTLPLVSEIILIELPWKYNGNVFFPDWPLTEHGWAANEIIDEYDGLKVWSYIKKSHF